ncbi:MAG: hypothetical protein NC308_10240 [Clostridium sp.]|nr:hypothetical protein [Bacteroides sp.]MCM1199255.1 hypothetical protein [Clostridium sp.]
MKKIYLTLTVAFVFFGLVSCDKEAKFSEYIPLHPLTNLVYTVTATGERVYDGSEAVAVASLAENTVDNSMKTIRLTFDKIVDLKNIRLNIEFAERAILVGETREEMIADLTKPFSFTVNNLQEDVTYTVTAAMATSFEVNKDNMKGLFGLDGDSPYPKSYMADPANIAFPYLLDGKRVTSWKGYGDAGYKYFGAILNGANGDVPEYLKEAGYSGAFTLDMADDVCLKKLTFWPYWENTHYNHSAMIKVYAYRGNDIISANAAEGRPREYIVDDPSVGAWDRWELVGTIDAHDKRNNPDAEVATWIEFQDGNAPVSRYWRFTIVNNALYYDDSADAWGHRFTFSELDIEAYTL